ncbi:MAG TPA: class I SAM-dependent methyltransferase [Crocinitomix sp.]|nr:class I SAM-dependent methyltransferase [Crocinitomix sp.]
MTLHLPQNSPTVYSVKRVPDYKNNSLKAWNTSDEFMLWYVTHHKLSSLPHLIINDAFGYLSSHFMSDNSTVVYHLKSQLEAIEFNLKLHLKTFTPQQFITPLDPTKSKVQLALIKIPKSLELFELFLQQIHQNSDSNITVVCGFMTKYFTPQLLKIASNYFNDVKQTKAWKKSRLLVLSVPKQVKYQSIIQDIRSEYGTIKQYKGVFSSGHIDYATQFLIKNLAIPQQADTILDLASGNGILAKVIYQKHPKANIHLVDDSILAIKSSELNLSGQSFYFHHTHHLDEFNTNTFDYIISNPPFHLEHEIDLSLPKRLFTNAQRVLKPNGIFELVANRHLKYYPILKRLFSRVDVKAQNAKFIVYSCRL